MGKSWIGSSAVGAGPGYMSMGMGLGMAGRKPPGLFTPHNDALGFDSLGLGDPAYMWLAKDQSPNLARMVTRIGMPWEFVRQDGGTLAWNANGWGVANPTVEIQNGGSNVRTGFACDGFGATVQKPPASIPADYNRIFACAFVAPTALTTGQVIWPYSWSDGTLNTRWGNYLFQGSPTGHGGFLSLAGSAIFNSMSLSPGTNWVGRKFLWLGFIEWNPNSADFECGGGFRMAGTVPSGGYYPAVGRTSQLISNGSYPFTHFTHGYEDTPTNGDAATGLQYAGSVGWVGQLPLGTNTRAAMINSILDTWAAICPI